MTKIILLLALNIMLIIGNTAKAQKGEWYSSSGGEMIFSFASVDYPMSPDGQVMRFSPVFNFQSFVNYDFSHAAGFFSGVAVRNVGFIYKFQDTGQKKKFRNYDLGIPFGLKIGDLDRFYVYGGYEIEFPLNYKEKTFENEKKVEKFSVWFSKRTPSAYNTLFFGLQFPYGPNIKFKYYLNNFHNRNYTEAGGVKPYTDLKANVFYVSLNFNIFRNTHFYYFHD